MTSTQSQASPRQVQYIRDLLNARQVQPAKGVTLDQLASQAEGLSRESASAWIGRLRELPMRQGSAPVPQKVPAGRYAITGADGTTDFYKVDKPTKGRWAGYTFVKLQLSDDYQRLSRSVSETIIRKIEEAGPEAASKRYGMELGHCGICGKTLTNPDSIERGIGPVCAGKMDWSF